MFKFTLFHPPPSVSANIFTSWRIIDGWLYFMLPIISYHDVIFQSYGRKPGDGLASCQNGQPSHAGDAEREHPQPALTQTPAAFAGWGGRRWGWRQRGAHHLLHLRPCHMNTIKCAPFWNIDIYSGIFLLKSPFSWENTDSLWMTHLISSGWKFKYDINIL